MVGPIYFLFFHSCFTVFVPPTSSFQYEGRFWHDESDAERPKVLFDWSCTTIIFTVSVQSNSSRAQISLDGGYHRFQLQIRHVSTANTTTKIFVSSNGLRNYTVNFPTGQSSYVVSLRKLTESTFDGHIPTHFGPIAPQTAIFYGIFLEDGMSLSDPPKLPSRKMEFYGASDSAGFGADGYPNPGTLQCLMKMNHYENCAESFTGQLATKFNAQIHLQAMAGRGLLHNAEEFIPILKSGPTIPETANRTLCADSDPKKIWKFASWIPDVIIMSIGGNDYNNLQKPVESDFVNGYMRFMNYLFSSYAPSVPTIINVCGGSSPSDPSRNRCCPFVGNASKTFNAKYPSLPVHFIELPLDIVPDNDIACMGHHNADGHRHIVDYLAPRIQKIMNW